jgi:hypothetical protein
VAIVAWPVLGLGGRSFRACSVARGQYPELAFAPVGPVGTLLPVDHNDKIPGNPDNLLPIHFVRARGGTATPQPPS